MEALYKLVTPPPIDWVWVIPLGISIVISLGICLKALGLRKGSLRFLKGVYVIFIEGRWSLRGIDITITGFIILFLARAFSPFVNMVLFSIANWFVWVGCGVMALELLSGLKGYAKKKGWMGSE